jgi:hypothetical protein
LNIQHLQAEINAIHQDTAQIDDSAGRAIVKRLLNLVERLAGENAALESERQELRDEINRLKGEQGKPDIKADKKKTGDISSETERKEAEANATKCAGSGDGGAAEEAGGKKTRIYFKFQGKAKIKPSMPALFGQSNPPATAA